jgi:integrase
MGFDSWYTTSLSAQAGRPVGSPSWTSTETSSWDSSTAWSASEATASGPETRASRQSVPSFATSPHAIRHRSVSRSGCSRSRRNARLRRCHFISPPRRSPHFSTLRIATRRRDGGIALCSCSWRAPGARVSEAVAVDAADLRLEQPRQVLLRGKGRKQRSVPLSADLGQALRALCRERGLAADEHRAVFVGASGERLTRFGVTHLVRRAVNRVAMNMPAITNDRISPHIFRHTLAMQLLRGRVDIVTIQAWLGHAQVTTTHRYAEADVEMMWEGLDRAGVGNQRSARFRPKDAVLQLLESV